MQILHIKKNYESNGVSLI